MKTVLIPTDFSKSAMHAINYALQLYKCELTHFYFIHAYADEVYNSSKSIPGSDINLEKKAIKENSDQLLHNLIHKITVEKSNPKHKFESISAFESLVDAVNDFTDKINTDLIIMGTKGKTDDKKLTFGSHTVQVFKYVKCPVLAVPEIYNYQQPKNILFPTDYSLPYRRRELKLLNTLAAEFKSKIHCVHISDFEELSQRQIDNKRFLQESLSKAYVSFGRTPVKNKVEAIMDTIKDEKIDLLVMINSRHSFLEDMLYRSTIDKIGLHIKIPFLVLQNFPR